MTKTTRKPRKATKVKLAKPAARQPGIISTIISLMSRSAGATADEVLKHLAKRFPDRQPKVNTAKVNLNHYATRKERTDAGVRYWLEPAK